MIVGLTGGIGSGKSTVAAMFKTLGIPVYMADAEAHKLMECSAEIKEEITGIFGTQSYRNNKPDTRFLADIVFKDKEKLRLLNAIIHPRVHQHFLSWHNAQKAPYVVREAAILFESGSHKDCDKVITVTAPLKVKIQRVVQRDKVSEAMVKARMQHQWPDEKKAALSDFVIKNIDINKTVKEVEKIHNTLIENYIEE